MPATQSPRERTRREFLARVGTGTVAALAGCQAADQTVIDVQPRVPTRSTATRPATTYVESSKHLVYAGEYCFLSRDTALAVPIIPRCKWAKAGPEMAKMHPLDRANMLVFMQTNDIRPFREEDFDATAKSLEARRELHRERYFADIGWHFAIDRVGRIWELRSMQYQPQAVRYHNANTLAVVVLGNYDLQTLTEQQRLSIVHFGRLLRQEFDLPIEKTYSKRELVASINPGQNMHEFLLQARRNGLI